MQQHLMQMQPMMAAYYPNNVTTDHIQQYLDENKSLILKIVESQNSGKLGECADTAGGSGALGAGGFPDFGRGTSGEGIHAGRPMAGGSKQDIGSAGSAEGRGGSSGGQGGDGGETLYLKAADDGN
ncbi:hypothetical protein V6N13_014752 [Hibiscus sabdariffa]